MKTFFVHHSSPHHAKNSGYNRILDYYPEAISITGISKIPYGLARLIATMHNQKAGLYNSDSVFKELELFYQLIAYRKETAMVHYLNAERDIRHVVNRKKNSEYVRFCGTFHKPPKKLSWRISEPTYVKHLDGAIAVGTNQVDYIREHLKISNVVYIPHGVDTKFFVPDIKKRKAKSLLFVGQHLRDFEALNYCVPRLAEKIKDLRVQIVLHPSYVKKVKPHNCLSIHTDLNDEELKLKYQEASLLFLPMVDSTACNSILEALACGLPIITTNVGGNATYLKDTNSILVAKNDYDAMIEATCSLLDNESELTYCSQLARIKAQTYDWQIVANQIKDFHLSL